MTLGELLDRVAAGRPPPADGGVSVLPPPWPLHHHAVLAFTAHHVVVTDADPDWVRALLPPGDLSAPLNPPFLSALSGRAGRRVNNVDLVMVAHKLGGDAPLPLTPAGASDHPRVERSHRDRDEVLVWDADGGVLVLGRGVGGRWEAAVEVDEAARGRGLGRALAAAARHLVPRGGAVWAQVAPGNAASVRAFLAAGFTPVGAEALLVPAR
jgi:GNAT superfamily N-acetyltransferase